MGGAAGVGVVGCTMGFRMLEESVSFGSKAGSSGGKGQLYLAYRKGHTPLGMCEVTFKGGAYTVALWLFLLVCACLRCIQSRPYTHSVTCTFIQQCIPVNHPHHQRNQTTPTPTTTPTEVLDRLPRRDHHDFALPHDVLPMFSFPKGVRVMRVRFCWFVSLYSVCVVGPRARVCGSLACVYLSIRGSGCWLVRMWAHTCAFAFDFVLEQVKADKPPEPSYCSLVLTDENGRHYYIGASLKPHATRAQPISIPPSHPHEYIHINENQTGSITIYEPLSAARAEAVEAAILGEALRRGKSKEHLKVND